MFMWKTTIVVRTNGCFIKRPEVGNSENELGVISKMQAHRFSFAFLRSSKLDPQDCGNRGYYVIRFPGLIESIDFRRQDIWPVLAGLVKTVVVRPKLFFR